MRRALAMGLILLAGAALAGYLVAGRIGPEQVRAAAERSLARALGGEVRVAAARLAFGRGLAFEAEGLEAWPAPEGPALRVAAAAARIDPFSLLLGRVRLRRIVLDQAVLHLERRADGSIGPDAAVAAILGPPQGGAARGAWGLLERVGDFARALLQAPLPVLRASLAPQQIELRRARLVVSDRASGTRLAVENLEASLAQGLRARGPRVQGSGRLVDGEGECGSLTLEAGRDRDGGATLRLELQRLDLRAVAPYARAIHPELAVAGSLQGSLTVRATGADTRRLGVDVVVGSLRASFPRSRGEAPLRIAGDALAAAGELELTPRRLRLLRAAIDADGRHIELDGVAERPLRPDAMARLAVRLRDVDLEGARRLTRLLPPGLEERMAAPLRRVESGRVSLLELVGAGPLARWAEAADPASPGLPVDLKGTARFLDVAVRTDDGERIEGLSGELTLGHGRLELHGLRRTRDVPELDVTIAGLERLLESGRPGPLGEGPSLPGLAPLLEILTEDAGSGSPLSELGRLGIAADRLSHPLAAWPFEDLEASLGPPLDGVRGLAGHGFWGGLPFSAAGSWRHAGEQGPGRIALAIDVEPGPVRPAAEPRASWAAGTWKLAESRLHGLPLASLGGSFRGEGARLHIAHAEAPLARGGRLRGGAILDLSLPDRVPVELELEVQDGELAELAAAGGLERGDLEGRIDATARLAGPLRPGSPARGTLAGRIAFSAREGRVNRKPALSRAMAASGEGLRDLARDEPFRFRSMQGELGLSEGLLAVESLVIDSGRARIVASGALRLDRAPHEVEAVIGIFPDNAVDAIVGKVPVIGSILQGPDGQMIGRYLEVTGPWGDPRVEPIPGRSLATGMIEGLPHFVMSGLRAIGAALVRLGPLPGRKGS